MYFTGGSGLGLFISKKIVEMHQGSIDVFSAGENQGSSFILRLPVRISPLVTHAAFPLGTGQNNKIVPTSDDPPVLSMDLPLTRSCHVDHSLDLEAGLPEVAPFSELRAEAPPLRAVAVDDLNLNRKFLCRSSKSSLLSISEIKDLDLEPASPTEAPLQTLPELIVKSQPSGLRALVVDDSNLNRKFLCRSLKFSSLSVSDIQESEDGLLAVEQVRDKGVDYFDIILMDFVMPNMDGPTATKEIRSMGFKGRIVGVTGNVMQDDVQHFKSSGADFVLVNVVYLSLLALMTYFRRPSHLNWMS